MVDNKGSGQPHIKRECSLGAILMNLFVYPSLMLLTVVMASTAPFTLLLWKIFTGWSLARIVRYFIWLYGKGWLLIIRPFVRVETEGMDRVKQNRPCILVINHLSFFDTFFMGALPVHNVMLTLRSWPFRMFWYAGFMRLAKYMDLERTDWDHVLADCRKQFAEDGYMLFFPEGHRSRDGKMQRFHSGAFKVAIATDTPIIPLCITGTDLLLPPGAKWLMPSHVRLTALRPFQPAEYPGELGHSELRKAVKSAIAELVEKREETAA